MNDNLSGYYSTHSKDVNRGTSFRYAGQWIKGAHYLNDRYIIDFVVYINESTKQSVLLACKNSHFANSSNEPSNFFEFDPETNEIIGLRNVPDCPWNFVMASIAGKPGEPGTPGISTVEVNVDPSTGTPNVDYGLTDAGLFWINFSGLKGESGITPVFKIENGFIKVSYDNEESWQTLGNIQGPTGPRGPAFTYNDFTPAQLEGLRGPAGPAGVTSVSAEVIDSSVGDPHVDAALNGQHLSFEFSKIKGEKGDQGERGPIGETGEKGEKGDKGDLLVPFCDEREECLCWDIEEDGAVHTATYSKSEIDSFIQDVKDKVDQQTIVDDTLDAASIHPVQNKVVTVALASKVAKVDVAEDYYTIPQEDYPWN